MSPTILRIKEYRFYFLSNEEKRIHIHVESSDGVAKFWLEPIVSLAVYHKLNSAKLNEIEKIVEKHKDEIIKKWQEYFVSVENITSFGIWLFVKGKEYFLNYHTYPYFQNKTIRDIKNVRLLHGFHLYWPDLDIDLEIDNLENPEKYPLKSRI